MLLLVLGLVLESLSGLLDLLALVLLVGSVLLELLGQVVDLGRILSGGSGGFEFGIGGLIQVAELQLILLRGIQQLRRSRIQRTVVLLVGRRRRRIMRHLGQHPVFDLELL